MTGGELLGVALLGAVVGLDGTSLGQFMVSRPFVAATLAGALVGSPLEGAAVGAILELFQLSVIPAGGARFPESGPAAVAAAATAAVAGGGPPGVAAGAALGLVWLALGGVSVTYLRLLNSRRVPDPTAEPVSPRRVARAHLAALGVDAARGALLALAGAAVGVILAPPFAAWWPLDGAMTSGMLVAAGAAPLGVLVRTFGGWQRWRRLFLAGLLAGSAALAVL